MKILNVITDQFVENKENREKWDKRFLELARHIASWSKDPSTQVGAVLVKKDWGNKVVGLGYNGFARGVEDTEERLHNRELKYKYVVHAEVNAITMAENRAHGATMYVWPAFDIPCICNDCCKIAIQAGVAEIVGYSPEGSLVDKRFPIADERKSRWAESIAISKQMCDEAGVTYRGV